MLRHETVWKFWMDKNDWRVVARFEADRKVILRNGESAIVPVVRNGPRVTDARDMVFVLPRKLGFRLQFDTCPGCDEDDSKEAFVESAGNGDVVIPKHSLVGVAALRKEKVYPCTCGYCE